MKIKHRSIFKPEGIAKIEEQYGAKYLLDCAIKGPDFWSMVQGAVFYQREPYPETGSHYFCMYVNEQGNVMITGADWIEKAKFYAYNTPDGLVYSIDRHDFVRVDDDKGYFLDGGRDYLRTNIPNDLIVPFEIEAGHLWIAKMDDDTGQSESPDQTKKDTPY